MAKQKIYCHRITRKSRFAIRSLLFAGALFLGQGVVAVEQSAQLNAKMQAAAQATNDVQIKVYEALEQLHGDEWLGKVLSTEELIQTSTLSDLALNNKIIEHLESKRTQKEKAVASSQQHQLECILGKDNCLYKDKAALIAGDVTSYAQLQFEEGGASVTLPGSNELIDTQQQNKQGATVIIDAGALDSNGRLEIDSLLDNKMAADMQGATEVPASATAAPAAPATPVSEPAPAQLLNVDDLLNQKAPDALVTTETVAAPAKILPAAVAPKQATPASTDAQRQELATLDKQIADKKAQLAAQHQAELDREIAAQRKAEVEKQAILLKEKTIQEQKNKEAKAKQEKEAAVKKAAAEKAAAAKLEADKKKAEAQKVAVAKAAEEKKAADAKAMKERITNQKHILAEKLKKAGEAEKKAKLEQVAKQQAKELAKKKAQEAAEARAGAIAEQVFNQQLATEEKKQMEILTKKRAKEERVHAIAMKKKAEENKKKQVEEEAQIRAEIQARKKVEEERAARLAEEEAQREKEYQDRLASEKTHTEDAAEPEVDLSALVGQFKSTTAAPALVQKPAEPEEQQAEEAETTEDKETKEESSDPEKSEESSSEEKTSTSESDDKSNVQLSDDLQQIQEDAPEDIINIQESLEKRHHHHKKNKKAKKAAVENLDDEEAEIEQLQSAEETKDTKPVSQPASKKAATFAGLAQVTPRRSSSEKTSEETQELSAEAESASSHSGVQPAAPDSKNSAEKHSGNQSKHQKKQASGNSAEQTQVAGKESPKAVSKQAESQQQNKAPLAQRISKLEQDIKAAALQNCVMPTPVSAPAPESAELQLRQDLERESKEFSVKLEGNEKGEPLSFKVIPNHISDAVKLVEIVDSDQVSKTSLSLAQTAEEQNSEFYNVTLNLVVRRLPKFETEVKQKKREDKKAKISEEVTQKKVKDAAPQDEEAVLYQKTLEEAAKKMQDAEQPAATVDKNLDIAAVLAKANLNTKSHLYNQYGTTDDEDLQTDTEGGDSILDSVDLTQLDMETERPRVIGDQIYIQDSNRPLVAADRFDMEEAEIERYHDQQVAERQPPLPRQLSQKLRSHIAKADIHGYSDYVVPHNQQRFVDLEFSKLQSSERQQQQPLIPKPSNSQHQEFMQRVNQRAYSQISEQPRELSDAEKQAQNLQKSLEMNKQHEAELQREDDKTKFKEFQKKNAEEATKSKHHESELVAGTSEINIEEQAKQQVSEQTVAKVQAELESKVQKLLDELTVLVNNKYSKGKHTYDYQLVRLTEGQLKAEREALEKADEVYYKHSTLKREEDEMNKRFDETQKTLNLYQDQFSKQKRSLQQDHDTYVAIKEKTEKELKDQLDIQQETEISVSDAFQAKIELGLDQKGRSSTLSGKYESKPSRAQQLVAATQSVGERMQNEINSAKEEKKKLEQEKKNKIQAEKKAVEQKKLEAKKKEEQAKQMEEEKRKKQEAELRAKIEAELKAKADAEAKKKAAAEELARAAAQKEADKKAAAEKKKREDAAAKAKKRKEQQQKEIALAEANAKSEAAESAKIEEQQRIEAEQLEKEERIAKEKQDRQVQKKKAAVEKAKKALAEKAKAIKIAQKQKEEEDFKLRVQEGVRDQALLQQQAIRAAEYAQQKAKDDAIAKEKEKMLAEIQAKAEQLELERAMAEAKVAEEAQKRAEKIAQKRLEELQKAEQIKAEQEAESKKSAQKKQEAEKAAKEEREREEKKSISEKIEDQKLKVKKTTEQRKELEAAAHNDFSILQQSEENMSIQQEKSKQKAEAEQKAKVKAESEAITKINKATLDGVKKGEEASKKLHADAKVQTEEQTTAAIEKLKDKFDSTKAQVMDIVSNFGKIHSDLQELKSEYLQEQGEMNSYLQIGSTVQNVSEEKLQVQEIRINQLKESLNKKKEQIHKVVEEFKNIHSNLKAIKVDFDEKRKMTATDLSLLQQKNGEGADTKLSKLFEKQSQKFQEEVAFSPIRTRLQKLLK